MRAFGHAVMFPHPAAACILGGMKLFPFTCLRPTAVSAPALMTLPYEDLALAPAAEHERHEAGIDWPHGSGAGERRELARRLANGELVADERPCLYVYRIDTAEGGALTGVVGCCDVNEYLGGAIRRHEQTRTAVEQTRAAHIEALGAQTGPVLLAHRPSAHVGAAVGRVIARGAPELDLTDALGARNRVWRLEEPSDQAPVLQAFAHVARAYIADGHHRMAASASVARARRARGEIGGAGTFLAALFDAHDFTLLSCNRIVRGAADGLVGKLRAARLGVTELPGRPATQRRGHASVLCEGAWFDVCLGPAPAGGALAALDATLLQDRVLKPVLGVDDPRRDARMAFVGGICGLTGLERACGAHDVAFALRPPNIDEVLCVSDAGLVMPPKSTWFEPKPRGGLFARLI